eukprot:7314-Heterococcus_DN1.PRE.7
MCNFEEKLTHGSAGTSAAHCSSSSDVRELQSAMWQNVRACRLLPDLLGYKLLRSLRLLAVLSVLKHGAQRSAGF